MFSTSYYSYALSEDSYKQIAEKLDVPENAKKSNGVPSDFWRTLLNSNIKLHEFKKSINKKKGAEKEALEKASSLTFFPQYDEYLCSDFQNFCDSLLINMGIEKSIDGLECSLHITKDDEPNAYTILTPTGFSMYLTTGLLRKNNCSYDLLMAVVAHEFAHGIFRHHLQQFYAEAKKKREYEAYEAMIVVMSAFAEGYDRATGKESETILSDSDLQKLNNNLKSATIKYAIRFGRTQEYEADIVAFRFMQWINKGDVYLDLLNFLGTENDYLYSDQSDHPKMADRIGLIRYLIYHPEVMNKEIEQLEKNKNRKTVRRRKNDYKFDDLAD